MKRNFLEILFSTIISLLKILKNNVLFSKKFGYEKRYSGKIAILANGPSLKNVLPLLESSEEFKDVEFSVHNFFAFTEEFFKIKPKFYALADPMFIMKNHRYEEVCKLFDVFQNQVDWDMNLYIVFNKKAFVKFSGITNEHIKIVHINAYVLDSWPRILKWLYYHGYSCPFIGTVLQINIYSAINDGFDEVHIYGADHTMVCNLQVNNNNELCSIVEHFYDNETPQLKPIIRYDGGVYSISEFLLFNGKLFQSHDQLRDYAEFCHSKIINYTKNSMIDSYERH